MFEVKEHPLITFRSTNVMVSQDKAFADVTGKLTIRGISKRIVFTARLDKVSSKEIKATGKFKIKLSDFKLKPPSPAFIRVNNEVEVRFDAIVEWEN
jgi:polyisoprenoid-binding protein YceI